MIALIVTVAGVLAVALVAVLFWRARLWEPPIWTEPALTPYEFNQWLRRHPGRKPPVRALDVRAFRQELSGHPRGVTFRGGE